MWVEIDRRFAEISGAPVGATYNKYVEGIARWDERKHRRMLLRSSRIWLVLPRTT